MSWLRSALLAGTSGAGGVYVLNQGGVDNVLRDILPSQNSTKSNAIQSSDAAALAQVVGTLSRQVGNLEQSQRTSHGILIQQAQPSTFLGIPTWQVVGLASTAGVIYFKVRGYQLKDLVYVSKRHFNDVTTALKGQIDKLGDSLENVRVEFLAKIGAVETKVDETRVSIEAKLDENVGRVENQIGGLSRDISELNQTVGRSKLKIDDIASDMNFVKQNINSFGSELDEKLLKFQMEMEQVRETGAEGNRQIRRDMTGINGKIEGLTQKTQSQLANVAGHLDRQSQGITLLCQVICRQPSIMQNASEGLVEELQSYTHESKPTSLRRPSLPSLVA